MFFSRWVFAVAFSLTFLPAVGEAQEQTNGEQGQAEAKQSPSNGSPFAVPVEIVENEADAKARARREAEIRQHDIDDLIAQQGVNAATQAMRDYAYLQTWFVGLGTLLLVGTLFLTVQATNAANAANQIARYEQRPWLTLKATNFSIHQFNDGTPAVRFEFDAKNVGNSPAKIISWGFALFIDDKDAARSEILNSAVSDDPRWILPKRFQDIGLLEPMGARGQVLAREGQLYGILFLVRYTDARGNAKFSTENTALLKRETSGNAGSYTLRLGNYGEGEGSQSSEERYT
jgi:hypothetical protein